MQKPWLTIPAVALLLGCLRAQAVNDVGLLIDIPTAAPVAFGQACGPVTCQPLAGPWGNAGQTRVLLVTAPPGAPFALAIGLPGPCLPIAGIANPLLLAQPIVLRIGTIFAPPLVPPCNQGQALIPFPVPVNAPRLMAVRFQALGVGSNGSVAFSPAIEVGVL